MPGGGWGWVDDDESDPATQRASANGVRQMRMIRRLITIRLNYDGGPRITPDLVCRVNKWAVEGLSDTAGRLRLRDVTIGPFHEPPSYPDVPAFVEEMCHVVSSGSLLGAIETAAYVVWRTNWIHPFDDGNGRTARALGYFVSCVMLGGEPPGSPTWIELLKQKTGPHHNALDKADARYKKGDSSALEMQDLIEALLEQQMEMAEP